jgi:hypothetical protein
MKICRELIFCLILFGAFFSGARDATAAAPGADQPAFPRSTDSYASPHETEKIVR